MRSKPRDVVVELPGFLGVARIVAQTELLVNVPRRLGEMLAHQESVAVFDQHASVAHHLGVGPRPHGRHRPDRSHAR